MRQHLRPVLFQPPEPLISEPALSPHGKAVLECANFARNDKERGNVYTPIALLLDTKGPEIRIKTFDNPKGIYLATGDIFTLTTQNIIGNKKIVSITYEGLTKEISEGQIILIDDGRISLKVKFISETDIICEVINGGELGQRKGVNVPNVPVRLPAITDKDKEDIIFGIEQDVDFIAASFVRNAAAIIEIKELLKAHNARYIPIIAKIENEEGINNIDEILEVADGIMVARGDLGVEIPFVELPTIQKYLIKKCRLLGKRVITATEMLESMIHNATPTRAEITDVANAVFDGTSALMLSGETANGSYPVQALASSVVSSYRYDKHQG